MTRRLVADARVAMTWVLDAGTPAAQPPLSPEETQGRVQYIAADVADAVAVEALFRRLHPTHVLHLAAESHVDNSFVAPLACVTTNVLGTTALLEAAVACRPHPHFLHMSTDEVCGTAPVDAVSPAGTIAAGAPPLTPQPAEDPADALLNPTNPYAAAKAGAEMMVRAYVNSHGLPATVVRCNNMYGPHQAPEKLVPLVLQVSASTRRPPACGARRMCLQALLAGKAPQVHGSGLQVSRSTHRPLRVVHVHGARACRRGTGCTRTTWRRRWWHWRWTCPAPTPPTRWAATHRCCAA